MDMYLFDAGAWRRRHGLSLYAFQPQPWEPCLLVAHVQAVAVVVGFVILVGALAGLDLGTRRRL